MKNLRAINIKIKIVFLVSLLIIGMTFISVVLIREGETLGESVKVLGNKIVPLVRSSMMADMMHDGLRAVVYEAVYVGAQGETEKIEAVKVGLKENVETFRTSVKELKEIKLPKEIVEELNKAEVDIQSYIETTEKIVGLALSGKVAEAEKGLPDFDIAFEKLEESLGKFGVDLQGLARNEIQLGLKNASSSKALGYWTFGLVLFFGIGMAFLIVRDLLSTLLAVSSRLGIESSELKTSSVKSQNDANSLSQSSEEQAAALQETAASVEEINAMVKKSEEGAEDLISAAETSKSAALKGRGAVASARTAIDKINEGNEKIFEQVEKGNQRISEIAKVIAEIGSKTKVINDIVFQTKLLSFNASVEAARAGEHGKGFAVVAEEVGNLAQMSGNAAKEIADMLNSGISRVEALVAETRRSVETLMADGRARVSQGVQVVSEADGSLSAIVESTESVNRKITEITTAIREQRQGISEISKAVHQLEQTTQLNMGLADSSTTAATSLVNRANRLTLIVSELAQVTGGGTVGQSTEKNPQNIVPMKTKEAKKLSARTQVGRVPQEKEKKVANGGTEARENENKKGDFSKISIAAADSDSVPSADDPRFQEF